MAFLLLLSPVTLGIAAAAGVAKVAVPAIRDAVEEAGCRLIRAEEILRKEAEKAAKKAARKAAKEAMSSSESGDSDEVEDNHGRRRVILMKN
ncbi:hypothetical protein L6164_017491 [Bauhinia variegata]|uniref:Uncharacterized protein n=2 Tax=Bauhinia variegata TaxID=167791 RepID=A0ACB9N7Y5_BAUVA|nr:hypothetical protein L6164_017488 [Bauhinia variegata]KAI4332596.1 hypothetical protein L6164_017491 [Bauhinia variegata]